MSKDKLIEKLSYISKSKKHLFEQCPLAFRFNYIDKVQREENPYYTIGNDVHDFIEKFFKKITIMDGELSGISKLKYHPNTSYKKNFVRFELERWDEIKDKIPDDSFFFPKFNERRWITDNPKLIGVVDRIHKCIPEDPFAPPHHKFKTGDLVIVENKTGKPTAKKCLGYIEDMLWYKIIAEIKHPELAPIKWGAIYFPYDNYIYHLELKIEECRKLAKKINKTRVLIINNINSEDWKPNPSKDNCAWCGYKKYCPHKV